jgi:hypothetical protein
MFGMTDNQHRDSVVSGFEALAEFLYDYPLSATLNTASRIDVQYSILEEDNDKAREEFAEMSEFMGDVVNEINAEFSANANVYDTCTHHIAQLTFGNGTVSYRVVWIEKTGDTEDE